MEPLRTALLFALVLIGSDSAFAEDGSQKLIENCRHAIKDHNTGNLEHQYEAGRCVGHLAGFRDGHLIGSLGASPQICIPTGVTIGQMIAIYVAWADKNPAEWHELESSTVALALRDAFPCNKQ
jgi:Rap1a immunity proteins